MIVDDCDSKSISWDGSDQAYKEFVTEMNLPIEVVHDKLGIVRKAIVLRGQGQVEEGYS